MASKGYIQVWNIPYQLVKGLIYFFAHQDQFVCHFGMEYSLRLYVGRYVLSSLAKTTILWFSCHFGMEYSIRINVRTMFFFRA